MKEITLQTKISDLLNDYDNMKDILIQINPKFKKLNNPVLRRTLAKVASVKQAAIVGGMDPKELVNILRKKVGQDPLEFTESIKEQLSKNNKEPQWINSINIVKRFDANELLKNDKNPLAEIVNYLKKIDNPNDAIVLKSDFLPEPLIEELTKKRYK